MAVRIYARVRLLLDKHWIRCLLLALIGFLARIPALSGQRVWDDDFLTRGNPFIKSPIFVLEVFRQRLFPESYSGHYRPVQNISYMADYLLWNGNFYGYHLSSILFHLLAGIFLYLLLLRLFEALVIGQAGEAGDNTRVEKKPLISWIAFLVALLWVVHPVHSAAVDYVSGRADSLAALFGAGGWLLYLRARSAQSRVPRVLLYGGAWFVGLLALCSRESACLWPLLFLIYLLVFDRAKNPGRRVATIAGCLALFAVYIFLRHLPPSQSVPGPSSNWSPSMRAVLMVRALGDYGRLMIFPGNLHMERSVFSGAAVENGAARQHFIEFEYLSILGLVVLAALIALSLRRGPGQRLRVFGAAWFIVAYLPTSNIVELNATVAEHWLYLPSVGFLIFLAGCLFDLPLTWRRVGLVFATVAVAALGIRSNLRSRDWESNEVFARQTIASGGLTIRVALLLAQVYSNREDYAGAERLLRKAVQLCPEYPLARNNLAHALLHLGKEKEAQSLFLESAKMAGESRKDYPRTWIAALNVAHVDHTENKDAQAIAVLDKARLDYPDTWDLISSETELLRRADQVDRSLNIVQAFAGKNWWHYNAWLALGRLYAQKGDNATAMAALGHATWLDLRETEALNLMAMIRMRQNRLDDAVQVQRQAVRRQPDQPQQYLLLSDLLDKAGRTREARVALAEVTRLRSVAGSAPAVN